MAKSIKYKNDYFLDSTSIVHNKNNLSGLLSKKESSLDLTNTKCKNISVNILRKQLNIVTLDFEAYAYFDNGYNLVGKIPDEYTPASNTYLGDVLVYFVVEVSGMVKISCGRVTKNGEVQIYNDPSNKLISYLDTGQQFRIHAVWFN